MKNPKIEITKYIAEQEGLGSSDLDLKKLLPIWWQNPRNKDVGGLKLTDEGFARLTRHLKAHRVRFEEHVKEAKFTNQLILRLDKFITCPWYLNHKEVWVFDDKMAIQLVLFSGNIEKFTTAKARSLDKTTG